MSDTTTPQEAAGSGLSSHALFAVGDVVEITANCMTKGKRATVAEHYFGKIEVSFSPQWSGWYLPEQLRKISSVNAPSHTSHP